MSIIRLEWEDAVAALLNMLCKDRIHDYGDKASKFITDTGLAGGSNIIDEALKIEVLNALYKQTYLNNAEKVNMYCITETDYELNLNYDLDRDINKYSIFILSDCVAFSELTGYHHYIQSNARPDKNDDFLKNIGSELILFITENMCINIDFDVKLWCLPLSTLNEEKLTGLTQEIKEQIMPNIILQIHRILDKILEYLYSVLDKLNIANKIKLFNILIELYNEINEKELSIGFNQLHKKCQLTFIVILQLLFLQYMSYYICKEICDIYKRVLNEKLTGRDTQMDIQEKQLSPQKKQLSPQKKQLSPQEQFIILEGLSQPEQQEILLEIKRNIEDYLSGYFGNPFAPLLSKIILKQMYNGGELLIIDNIAFLSTLLIHIKNNINSIIIRIGESLFTDSLIINLVSQMCNEQNINHALNKIIEEKQIQVALSFFFYDMLDIKENEVEVGNNELIKETIDIYNRNQLQRIGPNLTKIGDIGFLLRMIISNIEKLKASTTSSEIEDDTTMPYLIEMGDILIKILQKKDPRLTETSYTYYMHSVETKRERIDYTFEEIYDIVKEDILNKINSQIELEPVRRKIIAKRKNLSTYGEENVRNHGFEVLPDEENLTDGMPSKRQTLEARGGKKLSKKIISYDNIYYIIQSNLGLYNKSNNYYGGGIAQNNWLHMLKKFTIMALGMNNLTPNSIPAGTPNGGVAIDHTNENYYKFVPLDATTYGFNAGAENSELFSDWFNYEKLTIYGTNDKISESIEEDESIFIKRLFINERFSIPGVTGLVGLASKYSIIDDLMNNKARFFNLTDYKPTYDQHSKYYKWFNSPPVNIPNIDNLQKLKLEVTSEHSYANVKFPIYDEQVFNDDLFPLISKNIKDLSYAPPVGQDEYKMKYIVNNEAGSISSEIGFNELYNYASFSDPGPSGSDITKLLEYGEKYIMGFYGVTRMLKTLLVTPAYTPLKGNDLTYYNIGSTPGQVTELITDGYITILNPATKQHKIKIYSTKHNTIFNTHTPNNNMATYECERFSTDFGVDAWQRVTLAVALKKSLDVLKKYMDSFIGKYYNSGVVGSPNVSFINTTSGTWKEWEFLFKDYGVIRRSSITVTTPNNRINTKYKSIPSANINNFVVGTVINGVTTNDTELPVWDNTITYTSPVYRKGGNNYDCWLRLPCFSIFNQISIFKGNGDICQELYTLTKFGGIYQDNSFHKPPGNAGYDPEILDGNTLNYLKNCRVYETVNYNKATAVGPTNFYGAGAYKIIDTVGNAYTIAFNASHNIKTAKAAANATPPDNFGKQQLSTTEPTYIPYDRFGNAPRGFVSGDRLSGLRYIMLSFLGLKYYIRRIYNNNILTNGPPGGAFTPNQQLCNNINILSFGGYNSGLLSSIMSKINFNFIQKIYQGKTSIVNNQIYNILENIYSSTGSAVPAIVPAINQFDMITNYAGINAGGGKKSKSLKQKSGKKIIKKKTKKISKKHKKTIKKNSKNKLRKTYKNKK
jgi:hypothetical protein